MLAAAFADDPLMRPSRRMCDSPPKRCRCSGISASHRDTGMGSNVSVSERQGDLALDGGPVLYPVLCTG